MGYAGTLDRLVQWGPRVGVLDIKCGGPDPAYGIQTAGYMMLVEQPVVAEKLGLRGVVLLSRWSLHLLATGKYDPCDHEDRNDREVFKWCLGIHDWKRRYR